MRIKTIAILFTTNPRNHKKEFKKKKKLLYKDEKGSIWYSFLSLPAEQLHFLRTAHSGVKPHKFSNSL